MREVVAFDTNILIYALNASVPEHLAARRFLEELGERDSVVVSELVLIELYGLLRISLGVAFSMLAWPARAVDRAPK